MRRWIACVLASIPPIALACYSVDGFVGATPTGPDSAPDVAEARDASDASSAPDIGTDASADADAGSFDCVVNFEDSFDDEGPTALQMWSITFPLVNAEAGVVSPGRGGDGGMASLRVFAADSGPAGRVELNRSVALGDRTIIQFAFRLEATNLDTQLFTLVPSGKAFAARLRVSGLLSAPVRSIVGSASRNLDQNWQNVELEKWHTMEIVLDRVGDAPDAAPLVKSEMSLDGFSRSFPEGFAASESVFYYAQLIPPAPVSKDAVVQFDDVRVLTCTRRQDRAMSP